jgi:hypothetical protein
MVSSGACLGGDAYDHLLRLGFVPRSPTMKKSGEAGPDFCIVSQEQTIWIEAVTPSPEGIPASYLSPPKKGVVQFRPVLDEEPLMRWTSALSDKCQKLEADKRGGIIGDKDCTIIAVNACRLHDWRPNELGSSGFPFAVEAVFPIGHIALPVPMDGRPNAEPANIPRFEIRKPNNASVRTDNFLNPKYKTVSALLGCHHKYMMNVNYATTGRSTLTLVHNPLAAIPLPRGILGVEGEYVAEEAGDYYILRRVP